jgi:hypothetical protein
LVKRKKTRDAKSAPAIIHPIAMPPTAPGWSPEDLLEPVWAVFVAVLSADVLVVDEPVVEMLVAPKVPAELEVSEVGTIVVLAGMIAGLAGTELIVVVLDSPPCGGVTVDMVMIDTRVCTKLLDI